MRAIFLALILLLGATPTPAQLTMMERSPELDRLEPFVGRWLRTSEPAADGRPSPVSATIDVAWGPGDVWMTWDSRIEFNTGQTLHGRRQITWDAAAGGYASSWIDTQSALVIESTARWVEPDQLELERESVPWGDQSFRFRSRYHLASPSEIRETMWRADDGGPYVVHAEAVWILQGARIPRGPAIDLDGTVTEDEWAGALTVPLSGEGRVLLRHDGTHLMLGIVGAGEPAWAHVYLPTDDGVRVLHASAALGDVLYRTEANGRATPDGEFEWTMRDVSLSQEARIARGEFLAERGWVASTSGMGDPKVLEYMVRLPAQDRVRLAVAIMADVNAPQTWPVSLQDDTLVPELLFGETPGGLRFDPGSWAELELEPR